MRDDAVAQGVPTSNKKKKQMVGKVVEVLREEGRKPRRFSAEIAFFQAQPGGDIHHEACGDRGPDLLLHESVQHSSEILSGKECNDHDGKRGKMPAEP
jgi:hypothetical protein